MEEMALDSKKIDFFRTATANAENAVKNLKDPELRRIAFEKILEEFLQSERSPTSVAGQKSEKISKPSQKATARKANSDTAGKRGVTLYVNELVTDSFFKKQKTIADVKAELSNRGHHIPITSLSGPLQKLCQKRTLRRQKIKKDGEKETFAYSEW